MAIYYVNSAANPGGNGLTWDTAFTDLQEALDEVSFEDEIRVAQGTYVPSVAWNFETGELIPDPPLDPRSVSFKIPNGVRLYGGYDASTDDRNVEDFVTILSGDIGLPGTLDNAYHVTFFYETISSTFLDGFTVELGNATGNDSIFSQGAGSYVNQGGATFNNCIFKDNIGGGIVQGEITSEDQTIVISECTFLDNIAGETGGPSAISAYNLNVDDSTFENNSGSSAIVVQALDCLIRGSSFINNSTPEGGAAIYTLGVRDIAITHSRFDGNTANGVELGGGAIAIVYYGGEVESASINISQCFFLNNECEPGGSAISIQNITSPSVIFLDINRCVFSENSVFGLEESFGGTIFVYSYDDISAKYTNNLFVNNSVATGIGSAISNLIVSPDSTTTITNCTFYNNTSEGSFDGVINLLELPEGSAPMNLIIINSILWSTAGTPPDFIVGDTSNTTITYSDVQGGWDGTGNNNLNIYPEFNAPEDPIGPDMEWATEDDGLILATSSPLVSEGTIIGAPPIDLVGIIRTNPPTIGAYETISSIPRVFVRVCFEL